MVLDSSLELIGNTPLVRLKNIERLHSLDCKIYAKVEKGSLTGSIKDRAVLNVLIDYQERGIVKKGSTIIEATSGNTGIALSALGAYFGYNIIIVMPSSMSLERRKMILAYNAKLVLVDGGMNECNLKAQELNKEIEGSIIFGQFDSINNPEAHYLNTGKEIHEDLEDVDYIFAGIGTGGTISGIGKYYKEHKLDTKIIGIEPYESPLISEGRSGKHLIQGIGANFIPHTFLKEYVDEVITLKGQEAIEEAREIAANEGLLVGISSGCNLKAALNYIEEHDLHNKVIVVIFVDTGERYSWN